MTSVGVEEARATVAWGAAGLLRTFNEAGVLGLADVHTADAIGRVCGEPDDQVRLAVALAVRALRNGSVCLDLARVSETVFDESEEQLDVADLPWPEPESWLAACAASPALVAPESPPGSRPLRLTGSLLYLERYWQQEESVREHLQARLAADPPDVDRVNTAAALARLFGSSGTTGRAGALGTDRQRLAAAVSAVSRLTVLAGGPGTGKTTTVARLLALLRDQPGPPVRIALAAPTGKAAARLEEAVRAARAGLPAEDQERLADLRAVTLHRLLGWQPRTPGRFRHSARHRLPYDVVVVDEVSMVSLTLMARLLEAVRPSARLILVGDPDQLSSVEAGAVLADITGAPGRPDPRLAQNLADLGDALGSPLVPPEQVPVNAVVRLTHTWRFGGGIGRLAEAIRAGDDEESLAVLRSGAADVEFLESDPDGGVPPLDGLVGQVQATGRAIRAAAAAGDVPEALAALDRHRLLCAHRRGPYGVTRWAIEMERWLAADAGGPLEDSEWYLGRPVLITANDYELSLYNGDTGVVVHTERGPRVAFARGSEPTLVAPVRLDAVQTVHAMTVHRAQGSQFSAVTFILPPPESPLLTRELLYTAVTRARERVRVVGSAETLRRAVRRPANRASGLRDRL